MQNWHPSVKSGAAYTWNLPEVGTGRPIDNAASQRCFLIPRESVASGTLVPVWLLVKDPSRITRACRLSPRSREGFTRWFFTLRGCSAARRFPWGLLLLQWMLLALKLQRSFDSSSPKTRGECLILSSYTLNLLPVCAGCPRTVGWFCRNRTAKIQTFKFFVDKRLRTLQNKLKKLYDWKSVYAKSLHYIAVNVIKLFRK